SVALELFDTHPERTRPALATIKDTSRDAIDEVHALSASLRGSEIGPPTAPTSGIADLDALVERARASGLDVTTRIRGTPVHLPSLVDVAAARIVQESLTNVARHAAGSPATVTVTFGSGTLLVCIENSGSEKRSSPENLDGSERFGGAGPASGGGSGIPGMRERVRALGGTLTVGARPNGGFRVRAELPLRRPDDHDAEDDL
ncbi:sensor histidine kinase, partial [Rhodococcus chondri]